MSYAPSVVLTGTIVPNAIFVAHGDFRERRDEYLQAIEYYRRFAPVYFLENSSYDIFADKDFFKYENVMVRKFPLSEHFDKGKGYQEFEMIDRWVCSEKSIPSRWIKVTGRYIFSNFEDIYSDCLGSSDHIIIEQRIPPAKIARTDLFCVSTSFYCDTFLGLYRGCDDSKGRWIEHLVREKLQHVGGFRTFRIMPLGQGVSGSTGAVFSAGLRKRLKSIVYRLASVFCKKYRLI